MSSTTKKTYKGRMYAQERNLSLVGLRDLPSHLKTGTAAAQLTPIFSILLSNIEGAFVDEVTGKISDYMSFIELKPKFSSSMLDIRKDANEDSFGWVEDMSVLKQMPYEFGVLREVLDARFVQFCAKFKEESAKKLKKNLAIVESLNINIPQDTMDALQTCRALK